MMVRRVTDWYRDLDWDRKIAWPIVWTFVFAVVVAIVVLTVLFPLQALITFGVCIVIAMFLFVMITFAA